MKSINRKEKILRTYTEVHRGSQRNTENKMNEKYRYGSK